MKFSALAALSLITFSQAYAFDLSDTCDISRSQIKDILNQKSLSIRKAEREMLRMLSPNIDQRKLDDLIQEIKDNEYGYKNEVMSYSDIERRKKLVDMQWIEEQIPSEQEKTRHANLVNKSDASESELRELQTLAQKIQRAKLFDLKTMTEAEKSELVNLNKKLAEHTKRQKNYAQAQLNYNNYLKSEVLSKVSSSPETEIFNYDVLGTYYTLKNPSVNIEIKKDEFDLKEVSSDSFGYYSYPLYIDNIYNRIAGEKESARSYDIIGTTQSLEVYLTPSMIDGDVEYNNALKEIALNAPKTWTDFGFPSLDNPWGERIAKEITSISGDVKSSLDLATGKINVQYRTKISNKDGRWINFPEKYVSLDEMTELLLPKECRSENKKSNEGLSVSDTPRQEVKDLETKEPKKGFLKKLFGKKASKQ